MYTWALPRTYTMAHIAPLFLEPIRPLSFLSLTVGKDRVLYSPRTRPLQCRMQSLVHGDSKSTWLCKSQDPMLSWPLVRPQGGIESGAQAPLGRVSWSIGLRDVVDRMRWHRGCAAT